MSKIAILALFLAGCQPNTGKHDEPIDTSWPAQTDQDTSSAMDTGFDTDVETEVETGSRTDTDTATGFETDTEHDTETSSEGHETDATTDPSLDTGTGIGETQDTSTAYSTDTGSGFDTDTETVDLDLDAGFDASDDASDTEDVDASLSCENSLFITDYSDFETLKSVVCVDGDLSVRNSYLIKSLDLPNLIYIQHDLKILDNKFMRTISAPKLQTIGNHIEINNNASLPSCVARDFIASIPEVGDGSTYQGNAYDSCSGNECYPWAINLKTQEDIDRFKSLECAIDVVRIENSDLDVIDLPLLKRANGGIFIMKNQYLTKILLPRLHYPPTVQITDNPIYPTCEANDLIAAIQSRSENSIWTLIDNNLSDDCSN